MKIDLIVVGKTNINFITPTIPRPNLLCHRGGQRYDATAGEKKIQLTTTLN